MAQTAANSEPIYISRTNEPVEILYPILIGRYIKIGNTSSFQITTPLVILNLTKTINNELIKRKPNESALDCAKSGKALELELKMRNLTEQSAKLWRSKEL